MKLQTHILLAIFAIFLIKVYSDNRTIKVIEMKAIDYCNACLIANKWGYMEPSRMINYQESKTLRLFKQAKDSYIKIAAIEKLLDEQKALEYDIVLIMDKQAAWNYYFVENAKMYSNSTQ